MTGNMFVRKTGVKNGDKNLVMLVGIIGLSDEELKQYNDESMYVVSHLQLDSPKDLTEQVRGMNADNLLTSPIWRV